MCDGHYCASTPSRHQTGPFIVRAGQNDSESVDLISLHFHLAASLTIYIMTSRRYRYGDSGHSNINKAGKARGGWWKHQRLMAVWWQPDGEGARQAVRWVGLQECQLQPGWGSLSQPHLWGKVGQPLATKANPAKHRCVSQEESDLQV